MTPSEPPAPEVAGHRHVATWDLKEDRLAALVVHLLFVVTAAAFAAAPFLLHLPLGSGWGTGVPVVVTVVACLTYMWIHEATHGVLLTAFSGLRSHYALRFP